jgi:hypothetical protein
MKKPFNISFEQDTHSASLHSHLYSWRLSEHISWKVKFV